MDYVSFCISQNGRFIFRTEKVQGRADELSVLLSRKFPKEQGYKVESETRSAAVFRKEIYNG